MAANAAWSATPSWLRPSPHIANDRTGSKSSSDPSGPSSSSSPPAASDKSSSPSSKEERPERESSRCAHEAQQYYSRFDVIHFSFWLRGVQPPSHRLSVIPPSMIAATPASKAGDDCDALPVCGPLGQAHFDLASGCRSPVYLAGPQLKRDSDGDRGGPGARGGRRRFGPNVGCVVGAWTAAADPTAPSGVDGFLVFHRVSEPCWHRRVASHPTPHTSLGRSLQTPSPQASRPFDYLRRARAPWCLSLGARPRQSRAPSAATPPSRPCPADPPPSLSPSSALVSPRGPPSSSPSLSPNTPNSLALPRPPRGLPRLLVAPWAPALDSIPRISRFFRATGCSSRSEAAGVGQGGWRGRGWAWGSWHRRGRAQG